MTQPTGEQFEISCGRARAVVTEVGAGLRLFEIDGVPYTETFPATEAPPLGAGAVLLPWPNRVAGARWWLDGVEQRLEPTEPARGNAIHGLVRQRPWQVIEHAESQITLATTIDRQPGWPVPVRTSIGYRLADDRLTVTHQVTNIGSTPIGFGAGAHPYLRAGTAQTDDCSLRLSASTVLPLDPDTMAPSGQPLAMPAELDFRIGRRLEDVELDTPFGGCVPGEDGRVHHELRGPDVTVDLWADPDFRWVQVFTPADFPGRGRAVAIEPMTCPPDALNSGVDLITLAPERSWTGRWGLVVR